ncbi:MAG: polysaccharide deacetylase family protein [Bacteroidales bacterium]|jgi:peptidoglycan/xylan/chitin deacetylase (PgdA/CDA1 family)|nr:polysaccharide deacetylase family protein [Bacteroidales bacterium]
MLFIAFVALIALVLLLAFLVYASFHISSGVYVQAFCRGNTPDKKVALTFDDGPHEKYTPQVLDILYKYKAKASFFVIGKNVKGHEKILMRMKDDGHIIGVHSQTHHSAFPFFSVSKIIKELRLCARRIEYITGYAPVWFRPPFGVTNPSIASAIKKQDFLVAGWNIRSLDTVIDKNRVIQKVLSRLQPGAIVLLHDHLPDAPYILEEILKHATEQGYEFVTVEEMYTISHKKGYRKKRYRRK